MAILCGVDFSEASWRAARVAAGIAIRRKVPLYLVHGLPDWPVDEFPEELKNVLAAASRLLERDAASLRGSGADVRFLVEQDPPERSLVRVAKEKKAAMLVVGATGKGGGAQVGRTADRLAQQSHVPTLIVRGDGFEQWVAQKRALHVTVAVDFNRSSEDAWRWARTLEDVGPVKLTAAHVYWPPQEFARLGLGGLRSYVDADPEVDRVLRRQFAERFEGAAAATLRVEPGIGRRADHLLAIAKQEKADLVVVGAHLRSEVARLWEGSVSRGILHEADASVACVPSQPAVDRYSPVVRTALAATDFSAMGDAAVAHAFAQVPRGGKVFLVHVLHRPRSGGLEPTDIFKVSASSEAAQKEALEKLRGRIPVAASLEDKTVEPLVLESDDVAEAIAQAGDRLCVDLLCLGTHARTGVARVLLGSVAQSVLSKTERPVLLLRRPVP